MRLPLAFALLLASTAALAVPPVYRCEMGGKVNYSDAPCIGGSVVDVTATQGMDRMSGTSRKGRDVQRAELTKAIDEALRPIAGLTHDEMNVVRRRVHLPAHDQTVCRQLDARMPNLEAAAKQSVAKAKARADVDLYLARKRYFDLRC